MISAEKTSKGKAGFTLIVNNELYLQKGSFGKNWATFFHMGSFFYADLTKMQG